MSPLRHLHTLTLSSTWARTMCFMRDSQRLPQQELLAPGPSIRQTILRTLTHVDLMDVFCCGQLTFQGRAPITLFYHPQSGKPRPARSEELRDTQRQN